MIKSPGMFQPIQCVRGLWPKSLTMFRISRSLCFLVCLNFGVPGFAASSDSDQLFGGPTADTLYDVQYLYNQAEQGDARAAFLLGTRFASGRGGARDDSEAFRWFKRASEAGLAEAQYNLGVMYASGRGVPRNMVEAARWYKAAADQGIAEAQFNIGTLYGLGLGVPRNETLAAEWLHRAADKELPQAQYNLGVLYEHGRGVRLDARAALVWYQRAAAQGFAKAEERLAALTEKLSPSRQSPPLAELAATPPAEVVAAPNRPVEALPVPVSAAAAVPAPAAAGGSQDPGEYGAWIADLDPGSYTLQLLSNTDQANVRDYVRRNIGPGEGDYFATRRGGQVWYSVVYGVYPSYSDAKQAATQLPSSLGKRKPWIRKVESVQQQMLR